MAVNVLNAFVGAPPIDGGVFYRAPIGQTPPTSALTSLPVQAEDHGAVGENGISVSQERSSTDIKMFGGDTFIDVQDNYSETVTLTLLEDDNDAVLKTAFGDANVEKTAATDAHGVQRIIYHTSDPLPISTFYIRTVSGEKKKLYYIDRGRVASVSEVVDVHNNVTSRQLNIKTFKPSDVELKGGNVVEFRDDGVVLESAAAVITGITPATVDDAGQLIQVHGRRFTGTTAVTIDGASVEFSVVSDTLLVVDAPADTPGEVDLIVTNATGPSVAFKITYA